MHHVPPQNLDRLALVLLLARLVLILAAVVESRAPSACRPRRTRLYENWRGAAVLVRLELQLQVVLVGIDVESGDLGALAPGRALPEHHHGGLLLVAPLLDDALEGGLAGLLGGPLHAERLGLDAHHDALDVLL
eukprot:scaffold1706_cov113-Isochrysis_galbana.AAC.5